MNFELNKIKGRKVLVVGDVMLDTYHIGDVKRISPEAPVPVVRVNRSFSVLGGAANLARNIVGLGAIPYVAGVVGDDENGDIVRGKFSRLGINSMVAVSENPTITKVRIIGNDQQVVRMDFEAEKAVLSSDAEGQVIDYVRDILPLVDIVVISDYGKGLCSYRVCSSVIKLAQTHSKKVIVDPKGTNWTKYMGATIVTPNIKELSDVAGSEVHNVESEIVSASKSVIERCHLDSLLVTRSEMGMTFVDSSSTLSIATEAREVFDVSGAGDTVVATFAVSLASGFSLEDSLYLANKAAGVVVGKVGTSPIFYDELYNKLHINNTENKVVTSEMLPELLRLLSLSGKRVVFTNGCFDILHKGHITYLQKAKELGDILILGLNSDNSVRRLKGDGRPINNEDARSTVMAALSCVDYVILFDEDTPYELIKSIRPSVLVKGGDYAIEDIVGREFAEITTTIPFVEGFSTTLTLNKLNS